MKVYVITEHEVAGLLAALDRDPRRGVEGGSPSALSPQELAAHDEAHRFYNYQVRRWLGDALASTDGPTSAWLLSKEHDR